MKAVLLLLASSVVLLAQTGADYFGAKVYPVLESAQCRGCHASDGVASATRIHFPEAGATADAVQDFGISLGVLIDRSDLSKSLLVNKPTNRIRHTGGERIKPGSEEEKVLQEWVRYLGTLTTQTITASARRAAGAAGSRPDQFVRRLTHSQYNNTVRDLLGDFSRPADRFPAEDFIDGFKNQLRTQSMPPLLVAAYSAAAEKLALNAFRAGDVNNLVPCKPASAADPQCRDAFIRGFGERAFRRPLLDTEIRRYTTLFTAQAENTGKFLEGARVVVEAILQSPKFLFHLEGAGGKYPDHEIANRLAYLFWNTMPDRALFDAAAKGELRTPEGRVRAAERMLAQPPAREAIGEFFGQWMRFDHVLGTSKDRRRYPEFTPELAAIMVDETRRLLDYLVWENRSFMEALTADYGFLNSELASFYQFPTVAGDFQFVKFPAETHRAGILGHASFLAATAGPVETSPTMRGIFVREQLLCQHVPNPPPGVNTTLPEPTAAKPLTRRQRLAEHATNATCAGCHKLMDPIGFGLENFDGIGRWRDKERIEIPSGEARQPGKRFDLPLDTTGEIAGIPNSAFSDLKQLGRSLAASPVCQECIVRQVFRYAYGRMETSSDQETIRELDKTFRDSGFQFQKLWIALVRAPQFLEGVEK